MRSGEGENTVLDFDLGSFFSSASVWDHSQFETVVIIIGTIGYSLYKFILVLAKSIRNLMIDKDDLSIAWKKAEQERENNEKYFSNPSHNNFILWMRFS